MLYKLKGAGHCTSAKCMISILRHVAEATNTSMVLNCSLVTYIMMKADVGLPDAA